MRERVEDDRAERREADAAGDDDDVSARGLGDRPRVAARSAQAEQGPGSEAQIAPDTAPTARTVRTIGSPASPGSPLTEIGTSPIPQTCTITNWPGSTANPSASGSNVSVHVSTVSCRRSATRNGSGTNAPTGWSSG